MNRNEILQRVRNRRDAWDIVVIGGGATGVGCALDAASRGLDVLLLEQHDFGKGTSSRSTKLVHGGVRYLAQGNISLVREALKERGILLRNAPHIVRKQAFVVPCYSLWQKFYYGLGLKTYDLLAGKQSFGNSRVLSKNATQERFPNLRIEKLKGGILYYDGQFDDTRLLIDMVATADRHGASSLNYARVCGMLKNETGRIEGVDFEDVLSDEHFSVSAKAVINATGVFCDAVRELNNADSRPLVTLSQGIHLVFDRKFVSDKDAIMIPKTSDGRVLFCIPWHGHILVGTTDTPVGQANLEPQALDSEIDFVLETAGKYLNEKPSRADILSLFVGIRPLVRFGAAEKTSSLSRGHLVEVDASGLVTVTGGKWTIYRRMAEDAVDIAVKSCNLAASRSKTIELAITARVRPNPATAETLHPDLPYSVADVSNAVRHEMAQTVEDVLARRTRSLFLNAQAAIECAEQVAHIIESESNNRLYKAKVDLANFHRVAKNYLCDN